MSRLTAIELIYAALVWVLRKGKHVGMDFDDMHGYVGHVAYMCRHAITGTYSDSAFRGYDKVIRDKAKAKGLRAFRMGDQELSMLHFTLDNSRYVRRPFQQTFVGGRSATGGGKTFGQPISVCYAFNYCKDGCTARRCE